MVPELSLGGMIERGFLTEHLPPCFTAKALGGAVDNDPDLESAFGSGKEATWCCPHNLARPGGVSRRLGIPNPVSFFHLAKTVFDNWGELKSAAVGADLSTLLPAHQCEDGGRALIPHQGQEGRRAARAKVLRDARFLLVADVSSFYSSIYTHSIPWALHGKAEAKKQQGEKGLLGNRLDKLARNCQGRQTRGIPIGPDTSHVLAELILAKVDSTAFGTDVRGMRFVDDYFLAAENRTEAEHMRRDLIAALADFELELNEAKTRIVEAPAMIDDGFVGQLQSVFERDDLIHSASSIVSYFDLAFRLSRDYPRSSVLAFAVSNLRGVRIGPDAQPTLWDLVAHSIRAQPGSIRYALDLHSEGPDLDSFDSKFGDGETDWNPFDLSAVYSSVLSQVIMEHAPLLHGSEVLWALWGALKWKCNLSEPALDAAAKMGDSAVSSLLVVAVDEAHISKSLTFSQSIARFESEKSDWGTNPHWLFAHELALRGMTKLSPEDVLQASDGLIHLAKSTCSFVDIKGGMERPSSKEVY